MSKKNKKSSKEFNWRVTISFCPYENNYQRDEAYKTWARTYVQALIESVKMVKIEGRDKAEKIATTHT